MIKILSGLFVLLAILTACETIEVTPSPTPTDVSPVPTDAPRDFGYVDCFGTYQDGFQVMNTNENPCLTGAPRTIPLGTEDNRYASVYPGFNYWQVAGAEETLAYMNTGLYTFRDENYPAMEITVTQIDGDFGVSFEQVFEPGICHLIKATGFIDVIPGNTSFDSIWLSGAVSVADFDSNNEFGLLAQRFPAPRSAFEIFWMIETSGEILPVGTAVRVWVTVSEAGFLSGSVVRFHALEVIDAPTGFCNAQDDRLVILSQ